MTMLRSLTLGLILLPAFACGAPDASPEATFDTLWQDFDEMYGGFELRGIDWDDAYERYRPLVHDGTSDDELFGVLTDMLAETDDAHIHVWAPGREKWSANRYYRERIDDERFDLELVRREYLGGEFSTDVYGETTVGTLPSGHPYVHLSMIGDQMPVLLRAREQAETSGGLVLDLRHNGGGDSTWPNEVLAEWCSTPRPLYRTHTRNGPGREDFTPWFTWPIECRGRDIDFPVVVLIDRYTVSAGERAVLALDSFDGVTFLGETTNGAVSTTVGRELPNGWYMSISTQEVLMLDGTTIEAVGFAPDEEILNDPASMEQGVDAVIERAMELLEQG